jgi:hypothetical protein
MSGKLMDEKVNGIQNRKLHMLGVVLNIMGYDFR